MAIIIFTYENSKLIKLLKERGELIRAEDWKKVQKIEAEINVLKEKKLEKLKTPISAFVTFESEEGQCRALKLKKKEKVYPKLATFIEGIEPLEVKETVEPSDIIWENRHIHKSKRSRKEWKVITILAAALFISFLIIYYATKWQIRVV